jgi:hypothetical protein
LQYVNNQQVNNQSVRKRFNIAKNNVSFASKIIADTLEAGLIKASDPENASKKFASYVPQLPQGSCLVVSTNKTKRPKRF